MSNSEISKNRHYSEQTGHAARGEHERVRKILGVMPEGVPGYDGIKSWQIRRDMKRMPQSGKK